VPAIRSGARHSEQFGLSTSTIAADYAREGGGRYTRFFEDETAMVSGRRVSCRRLSRYRAADGDRDGLDAGPAGFTGEAVLGLSELWRADAMRPVQADHDDDLSGVVPQVQKLTTLESRR